MPRYEYKLTNKQERRKHGNNGGGNNDKAKNIVDTTLSDEVKVQRRARIAYDEAVQAGTAYRREANGSWYGAITSSG